MLAAPQMLSLIGPGLPTASPTGEKTTGASTTNDTAVVARTRSGDDELTSLSWLHNPGVLNSMCNALTGSPHRVSALGSRSARKPQGEKGLNKAPDDRPRKGVGNSTEKMLNVVLSVRNRRYNGEDAQKPPLSFACMIFMALESSPTKTLPVKQIYEWMQWKFPYYRTTPPGWKNSVRHNLSLIKCFKKVEKFSRKTRSAVTKGGLWTTDPEYRESLLEALKLNPYHPYHKYFTAPYFPRSMISALRDELELAVTDKGLGPAERDAALSMCMISGADNYLDYMLIRAVYHDHSYTQLPTPPSSPSRPGVSLDEVAAAAEMILGGCEEVTSHRPRRSRRRRRRGGRGRGRKVASVDEENIEDEAYNSDKEMGDEGEESTDFSMADSGYSGSNSPQLSHESRSSSIDDLRGADALLCLAKNATCPLPHEPQ